MELSNKKRIRLFIAIPLPDNLKEEFHKRTIKVVDEIDHSAKSSGFHKKIKVVEKENYHITLLFLGEIEGEKAEEEIEKIKEVISKIKEKKFGIILTGVGGFPAYSPRVVWVGIKEEDNTLKKLQGIHEILAKNLSYLTKQDFVPHITLGRVKFGKIDLSQFTKEFKELNGYKFMAERIALYQSILTKKGPIYKKLYEKELE